MSKIFIIAILFALTACSQIGLINTKKSDTKTVEVCSAQIQLNNVYTVSCETEESSNYSYCYIKNNSDSLLVWCDGFILAEMHLNLDLGSLCKPSDVDLKTREMKEVKELRKIDFKSSDNAFIIIDYGPKGKMIKGRGHLEILYYDTKLKQKLVFSTVNKKLKGGFDKIPNKFQKDIIKALETLEFNS